MALTRLVYASRMTTPLSMAVIVDILDAAVAHNRRHGISGILVFAAERFLQVLEGQDEAVDLLYERILRDPRHCDVRLISRETIDERMFGAWAMGSVDLARASGTPGAPVDAVAGFDPHALAPTEALALLWQVAGAQRLAGAALAADA